VDAIDATTVREFDARLVARKARPSTRRNVQCVLRSILCRYAVEAGILQVPPRLPRLPKVGESVVDTLTTAEVGRLLAVSRDEHRLAFLLAAHAGLRAGEVRGLRWRDVDLEAGRLVIRRSICCGFTEAPKSGHERIIPLTLTLRAALAKRPVKDRSKLVSRTSKGKQWGEFGLRGAFLAACKRAGMEGWRFHDLRHYFVTSLFRGGAPARAVQALAGHAHLTTTQRYAHVVESDLEDAVRRLGQ
jgi:integrase